MVSLIPYASIASSKFCIWCPTKLCNFPIFKKSFGYYFIVIDFSVINNCVASAMRMHRLQSTWCQVYNGKQILCPSTTLLSSLLQYPPASGPLCSIRSHMALIFISQLSGLLQKPAIPAHDTLRLNFTLRYFYSSSSISVYCFVLTASAIVFFASGNSLFHSWYAISQDS